jgi:predicted negative regulator of RcsB-dependent stress response
MDTRIILAIAVMVLLIIFATIGWHIWSGLRLKRQVDREYQLQRAYERARERKILSNIPR